jgi:hypothetical protein
MTTFAIFKPYKSTTMKVRIKITMCIPASVLAAAGFSQDKKMLESIDRV